MPKDQVSKPTAVSQPPRTAPTAEHQPPHPDADTPGFQTEVCMTFSARELGDRAILTFPHKQLIDFQKIVAQYDDTFSFFEVVNETYGNFKNIRQNRKKA